MKFAKDAERTQNSDKMTSHLFQPLHVDTNITYSLDLERFPGLEDPQYLYQPALLISTPETRHEWLSAMSQIEAADCKNGSFCEDTCNTFGFSTEPLDEDLFTLIESCNLSPTCYIQERPADDVIDDLSSSGELDFLEDIYAAPACDLSFIESTSDSLGHAQCNSYYHANLQRLLGYQCGYITQYDISQIRFNESENTNSFCADHFNLEVGFKQRQIDGEFLNPTFLDPTSVNANLDVYGNTSRRES